MTNTFGITARAYGWYEDNNAETAHSPIAAENAAAVWLDKVGNRSLILRYGVQESGTGSASGNTTDDYKLQYSTNGGGAWNDVTAASTVIQAVASPNLTDAGSTTQRMSSGTGVFVAGEIDEADGIITDWQLTANNFSELVYSIQVVDADVAVGTTITFRVLRDGGAGYAVFNTYSVTPTINIQLPPSSLVMARSGPP